MRNAVITVICALSICFTTYADDPIMGIWEGQFESGALRDQQITAYVIGLDNSAYRISVKVGSEEKPHLTCMAEGIKRKDVLVAIGEINLGPDEINVISFMAEDGQASGKILSTKDNQRVTSSFQMSKVYRKPASLGMAPPEGAIVLFDGNSYEEWNLWPGFVSDGTLKIVTKNTFVSKREFGDCRIHLEFCTPYMPKEPTGAQSRGNSGVYVQGRYEVQVLDSFGEQPADNFCGGIYKVAKPLVNACLPPGEWQTYDITFYAPRFDESGQKTKNAEITVYHNGKLIHDKVELPHPTPGGVSDTEAKTGPLYLQNHGDAVQYRNIWIEPLD